MDKEYLEARLANIQSALERATNKLETLGDGGPFEELMIEELREIYDKIKLCVKDFDVLVNLMQETREWLK